MRRCCEASRQPFAPPAARRSPPGPPRTARSFAAAGPPICLPMPCLRPAFCPRTKRLCRAAPRSAPPDWTAAPRQKRREPYISPPRPFFCCFFSHFSAFVPAFPSRFPAKPCGRYYACPIRYARRCSTILPWFAHCAFVQVRSCSMYTLVAVSGLLSPSAFVRLPEMRISVLHKGHSILFHLLDFISVFAPQKPVLAAPMAYWSRHLLAWLIARRQAAGACGRGLHPRGFATPHLLDFISVFAPQKPVLAAVRLHFACGGTALAGRRPRRGESGSRVWEKRKAPAFAGLITSLRRPTFLALRK